METPMLDPLESERRRRAGERGAGGERRGGDSSAGGAGETRETTAGVSRVDARFS